MFVGYPGWVNLNIVIIFLSSASLFSKFSMSGNVVVASLSSSDMITKGDSSV